MIVFMNDKRVPLTKLLFSAMKIISTPARGFDEWTMGALRRLVADKGLQRSRAIDETKHDIPSETDKQYVEWFVGCANKFRGFHSTEWPRDSLDLNPQQR